MKNYIKSSNINAGQLFSYVANQAKLEQTRKESQEKVKEVQIIRATGGKNFNISDEKK